MVLVGFVARTHGNRGEVILKSETDFPEERFRVGGILQARRGEGPIEPLEVTSVRFQQGRPIVGIAGIGSISEAERLAGYELRVPESEQAPLPDGSYYHHQGRDRRVVGVPGRPARRPAQLRRDRDQPRHPAEPLRRPRPARHDVRADRRRRRGHRQPRRRPRPGAQPCRLDRPARQRRDPAARDPRQPRRLRDDLLHNEAGRLRHPHRRRRVLRHSSGDAVGKNVPTIVPKGGPPATRTTSRDDPTLEGAHYMHPGPGNRGAVSHGLLGALMRRARRLDTTLTRTTAPELKSGWEAIVVPGPAARRSAST